MTKHRVRIDLRDRTATLDSVETFTFATMPEQRYYVAWDKSVRRVDLDTLFIGERFIVSAWHDQASDAYAEAVEALDLQIDGLAAIRATCMARGEVVNV